MTIRASAGTGFRVPYGFSEDLHLCSGSPRVYKSADLRPEKSVSANFSVDYVADPASKIVKTEPYWIINTKVNRKLSKEQTIYAGIRNLLSYVQPEKHPDDAAFMYAPAHGRIIYAGMEIAL
ncbi:MAG: hypothetical protein U9R38_01370 [Candidatus Margulisiibacteriota bacterium]|nr:hypothetical protein [Candidatus Margulisiibacteriota bacterium]